MSGAFFALTAAAAATAALLVQPARPTAPPPVQSITPAAASTDLSVMSYNIHGLPWPIAMGRPQALRAIGARLAAMRAAGVQPHLVLLQEAFTRDAKAIAREAGYPYAVTGPASGDRLPLAENPDERRFSSGARMLKGEGDGTVEDSGLLVLSDYPIIETRKVPYPRFACAGYDCLANKGVLMVRVAVAGAAQPVTVIDTHMNSRRASGVPSVRSDAAYGRQAELLRAFVRDNVAEGAPAIVAGDFNIGSHPYRLAVIAGGGGVLPGGADALRTALSRGEPLPDRSAAEAIVKHGKDWMFVRGGDATKLTLASVSVPFGREPDGRILSDHFGYVAYYRLNNAVEQPVATAESRRTLPIAGTAALN